MQAMRIVRCAHVCRRDAFVNTMLRGRNSGRDGRSESRQGCRACGRSQLSHRCDSKPGPQSMTCTQLHDFPVSIVLASPLL